MLFNWFLSVVIEKESTIYIFAAKVVKKRTQTKIILIIMGKLQNNYVFWGSKLQNSCFIHFFVVFLLRKFSSIIQKFINDFKR